MAAATSSGAVQYSHDGLRRGRAADRESLPGDPSRLQKTSLLARSGLWAASEEMVRESPADTHTVFTSGKALSPISPSRVGCIGWKETPLGAPHRPWYFSRTFSVSQPVPAFPRPRLPLRFPNKPMHPTDYRGNCANAPSLKMNTRTTTAPFEHGPRVSPPHCAHCIKNNHRKLLPA